MLDLVAISNSGRCPESFSAVATPTSRPRVGTQRLYSGQKNGNRLEPAVNRVVPGLARLRSLASRAPFGGSPRDKRPVRFPGRNGFPRLESIPQPSHRTASGEAPPGPPRAAAPYSRILGLKIIRRPDDRVVRRGCREQGWFGWYHGRRANRCFNLPKSAAIHVSPPPRAKTRTNPRPSTPPTVTKQHIAK